MKTILPVLITLLSFSFLSAQEVGETTQSMHQGIKNAYYLDLPDASLSYVDKQWKDFISQYGKVKRVKKADEMLVEGAQILDIGGANILNLYTRSEKTSAGTRQYLWIESGPDFISSANNPSASEQALELLREFALHIKVDQIQTELDGQQKVLDSLEKDLQRLRKDNDNLHETIEDAKARIAKAEEDLIQNAADQGAKAQEIERQREIVEEVQVRLETTKGKKS